MRTTRSKTGHRRSHHALEDSRLSKCEHCGAAHLRHRVCLSCGYYRGRKILDVEAVAAKKEKKQMRRQEKAQQKAAERAKDERGESSSADESAGREKPLSVEELSKK